MWIKGLSLFLIMGAMIAFTGCVRQSAEVVRPEKIYSKRLVIYDDSTYIKLADLWKKYYHAFPSEDAYANWIYAARYANDPDYSELLEKGLKKYPSNPTILYLKGILLCGREDNALDIANLERSAQIDPTYLDPYYGLVTNYMNSGEQEKMDWALKEIFYQGGIPDEIVDYNYNMLAGLEENAILVTNGDMDTYPGWVLQNVLNFRRDVAIINRSLLNTRWYPLYVMNRGAPTFITPSELDKLRENMEAQLKKTDFKPSDAGIVGDTLTARVILAGERENRPVYLAATLYITPPLKPYAEQGALLGLAVMVTKPGKAAAEYYRKTAETWLNTYRTSGMDRWGFHNANEFTNSGRRLMMNYGAAMADLLEKLHPLDPQYTPKLFQWYIDHLLTLIPQNYGEQFGRNWTKYQSVDIIRAWCQKQGYL